MRKLLLTGLIVFTFFASKSQDTLNFQQVENNSYSYFLQEKWDSLITLGKEANKQNIDYYYLNYRVGIAYFYKNNFMLSIFYLEKVLKQNSEGKADNYLINHLYKAYIYTNQINRASIYVKYISEIDRMKTNVDKHLREISYDNGIGISNGYPDSLDKRPNNEHIEYEKETDFRFLNLSASGQVATRLHYTFAFSSYNSFREKHIIDIFNDINHPFKAQQYQAYLAFEYVFKKSWSVHPAIQYSYFTNNPIVLTNPEALPVLHVYDIKSNYYHQYVGSIELRKTFRKVTFMYRAGYSHLLDSNQVQTGISLVYLPFGNLNLYGKMDLSNRWEGDSTYMVMSGKIGFKITSTLWMEGLACIGKLNNYQEDNAFNIYNLPDKLNAIYGINLIVLTNRQVNFRLNYQFFANESTKYSVSPATQNIPQLSNFKFNKQIISGGLTWKL